MIKKIKRLLKKESKKLSILINLLDNYQILPLLPIMVGQLSNHMEDVIQILSLRLIMLCLTGVKIILELNRLTKVH